MDQKYLVVGVLAVLVIAGIYFLYFRDPSAMSSVPGLKIETLKEDSGPGAKNGDTIFVHYVGTLTSGQKFDSSRDRGEPFSFQLGQGYVIPGWEKGILGMKVGELRRLTIAPSLGYGDRGAGAMIPPNATLLFEVEMLKVN